MNSINAGDRQETLRNLNELRESEAQMHEALHYANTA